jgi:D-aminoacyl-tRNA deacylase
MVLVSSSLDAGGTNIRERLIENFGFEKTNREFDSLSIYSHKETYLVASKKEIVRVGSELDEAFGSSEASYVFISKHRAESGIPSLTAHFTGNFNTNDFGGNAREISVHDPVLLKNYLTTLFKMRSEIPQKFQLTLEATHHGPTSLKRPVMFVELGSSEREWEDKESGFCVAKALMQCLGAISGEEEKTTKCAIGLGGTHYPEKMNKLVIQNGVAPGIIVPKYALQYLNDEMLSQILLKSTRKIEIAALDMKGLGKEKSRVIELANSFGLEILKL